MQPVANGVILRRTPPAPVHNLGSRHAGGVNGGCSHVVVDG